MNAKRKKRIARLSMMVFGVGLSVSLVLLALNKNINLYYTPSQLEQMSFSEKQLRVGGLVKKGSVQRIPHSLKMQFIITDYKKDLTIEYTGILPALFREGQGVVVEGRFIDGNKILAKQVLAKHDEKYMPPGIDKNVIKNRS